MEGVSLMYNMFDAIPFTLKSTFQIYGETDSDRDESDCELELNEEEEDEVEPKKSPSPQPKDPPPSSSSQSSSSKKKKSVGKRSEELKKHREDQKKEKSKKSYRSKVKENTSRNEREERDDSELGRAQRWLAAENLNNFGDEKGMMYTGGTPLFDERTEERIELLDHLTSKFPHKPWNEKK